MNLKNSKLSELYKTKENYNEIKLSERKMISPIKRIDLYTRAYGIKNKLCGAHKDNEKGYSQHGEDVVLEYIFSKIGDESKYYIEFGGGDGKWLSNTHYFRTKLGWKGLLLEGNKGVVDKTTDREEINLYHEFVTSDNINTLFNKYNIPDNLDLLSIDIDSTDFHIWNALNYYPKVVIIETNTGFPNNIPITVPDSQSSYFNCYFGVNGLGALRLAKAKGYEYVTSINQNMIFVKKELYNKLEQPIYNEEQIIKDYCSNACHTRYKTIDWFDTLDIQTW